MFLSPAEQGILVLYSLCIGIITGFIFEIFRFTAAVLLCISANSKKKSSVYSVFRFILDVLFSLIYTVIAVIFIYGANNGSVRYFILLFAVLGFVLYLVTAGKLISHIENKLSRFLYAAAVYSFHKIVSLLEPAKAAITGLKIKKYVRKRISENIRNKRK